MFYRTSYFFSSAAQNVALKGRDESEESQESGGKKKTRSRWVLREKGERKKPAALRWERERGENDQCSDEIEEGKI